MRPRRMARFAMAAGAALLAAAALAPSALAALTPDQQKCVTALQKDLERTDKQVTRQVHACIKGFGKERVLNANFCIHDDPRGKIELFQDRTIADYALRCTPPPQGKLEDGFPSFGVTNPTTVNEEAEVLGQVLAHDVFGLDLDSSLLTESQSKAGAKCQQKVWKAVAKCEQTRLKEFGKCSRKGLKGGNPPGRIDSAADLRDLCLGTGNSDQPDPKGKVAKKCGDPDRGMQRIVERSCGGVSLASAFPGCGASTSFATSQCLDAKVACRVCRTLNRADGLTRDCDRMDDGLVNLSCACGDGILNAGEQCDDGNNSSGDGCTFSCLHEIG